MRYIYILIVFVLGLLLTSCSAGGGGAYDPPVCEEGGEEVNIDP